MIWRLLPAAGGNLVGEDRDHTKRTVTFFCLDERSGIPRWKDIGFPELWWIGIEAVYNNVIFLHEFARPDLPDHKKITAVDLQSGHLLWSNEELKFLFAHEECVYASKETFETSLALELDMITGVVLREFKDQMDYINVLRDTAASRQISDVEFPRPLTSQDASAHQLDQKIARHIPSDRLRGEIELLEKDDFHVIGYYENISANPFEQELDQHLKIIDAESGALLFRDVLAQKAKTPVPDLFFIRDDILFYIKNRNLLRAVKLNPP